jgi:hypothetical protein
MLIKENDGNYVYLKDSDIQHMHYAPGISNIIVSFKGSETYMVCCTPEEAEGVMKELEWRMAARDKKEE